jgi:hypothetical protein
MSNREFLRVFQSYVRKINLNPREELKERLKRGNIFASSWSDKGEAERRTTQRGGGNDPHTR